MKRSLNIFVDSNQPLEQFVTELGNILGLEFKCITDEYETYYEAYNSQMLVSVGIHNFENDRQMNFEDYAYDISVEVFEDINGKLKEEFGNFIFDRLKAMQKYNLMLVDDLQKKLREFNS